MSNKFFRGIALLLALAVVAGVIGFFGFGLPLLGLPLIYGAIVSGALVLVSVTLTIRSWVTRRQIDNPNRVLQLDELTRREYQAEIQEYQQHVEAIAQEPSRTVQIIRQLRFRFLGLSQGIAKKETLLRATQSTTTLVLRPLETAHLNRIGQPLTAANDWQLNGQRVVDQLLLEKPLAEKNITIEQRGHQDRLDIRHLLEIIKNYLINSNSFFSEIPSPIMSDFEKLNAWLKSVSKAITYRYHPDKNANNPTALVFSAEFNAVLGAMKTLIQPTQCGLYQMSENPKKNKYDQLEPLLMAPYTIILCNNQFFYVNKSTKKIDTYSPFDRGYEERGLAYFERCYELKKRFPAVGEYKFADAYEFNLISRVVSHTRWDGANQLENGQQAVLISFIQSTDQLGYYYKDMDAAILIRIRNEKVVQAFEEWMREKDEAREKRRKAHDEHMKVLDERNKAHDEIIKAQNESIKASQEKNRALNERFKATLERIKEIEAQTEAKKERRKAALASSGYYDEIRNKPNECRVTLEDTAQNGPAVDKNDSVKEKTSAALIAIVDFPNEAQRPISQEEVLINPSQDRAASSVVDQSLSSTEVIEESLPISRIKDRERDEYPAYVAININPDGSNDDLETTTILPRVSTRSQEKVLHSGGRLNFLVRPSIPSDRNIVPLQECIPF